MTGPNGHDAIQLAISEMNAHSLDERMTHIEVELTRRIIDLEHQVGTLTSLIQGQNVVIGQYLQTAMGHGSTEPET